MCLRSAPHFRITLLRTSTWRSTSQRSTWTSPRCSTQKVGSSGIILLLSHHPHTSVPFLNTKCRKLGQKYIWDGVKWVFSILLIGGKHHLSSSVCRYSEYRQARRAPNHDLRVVLLPCISGRHAGRPSLGCPLPPRLTMSVLTT